MAELAPKRELLSRRERQIAEAYAAGRSHREIAERLFIAPATVRTHLGTIYRKLGVSTKIELLRTLETAGGPDAEAGVEEFAPSPQTPREPRADPSVTELLQELDLHQYADVFAANAVDMDVLMTLTDSELRELGVGAIGHRRRLAAAIHDRRSNDARADGVEEDASESLAPAMGPLAERRHLTIAFVDLAGSMELSTQLDPEQMQELLADYQKAVAKEAARFQGHLANVMGDEILVSFGWPNAHEDDAERAVWASLATRAAIEALRGPPGNALAVRIGIASGVVVVGQGMGHDPALAGDTPNLASHLRVLASPGQIIIPESTRRLLGDVFELADLGTKSVEGISEPVRIFAVTGERPVESRFDARRGSALLPMVGRDQELALLLERWGQAKAGEGQGVLLVGEAGIGKSRISRALLDAVAEEPHARIRYQCSPYHGDSALWPVIQQLTHAAGIKTADPDEAKLDKLEALLAQAHGPHAAPLIADLMTLDGAARYGKLGLTPQAQRARTLEALVQQLLGLAAQQPALVVLEDAHWIDPTTLELIEQSLDSIADAPVLIVLTTRPDGQPKLASHPHMTRLTLNRLGRAGVEAIIVRLGGEHLPGDVIGTIIARTDGVPLFVEELTKAVLQTGEATVPASLHDSLMARLDRIPEVKEVAQMAASIGREFDYPLLAAVAGRTEPDLRSALDKLAAAELIFRRGRPPDARYLFKHALVQDAAYQSLLKGRRQQLHGRIAEILEQRFPDKAETEPELLARHYTAAGCAAASVHYWERAGARATERSAFVEAINHYYKGLEVLSTLSDGQERNQLELSLQMGLGDAFSWMRGFAAAEVEAAYSRAHWLSRQIGETPELFRILWGLWHFFLIRGDLAKAQELSREVAQLGQRLQDPSLAPHLHRTLGETALWCGDFAAAQRESLTCLGGAAPPPKPIPGVQDPLVMCGAWVAFALWHLGYPDQALARVDAVLERAKESPHSGDLGAALIFAAWVRLLRRDTKTAREFAEAALQFNAEGGQGFHVSLSDILLGSLLVAEEQDESGLTKIRDGAAASGATGAGIFQPWYLALLAAAHAQLGDPKAGLAALAEAETRLRQSGERWPEAEIHRLEGELMLSTEGAAAGAEGRFRRSIEVAQEQQARSPELRAATSLARLWAEQGERQKAHDVLAPLYDWFTEGVDTPDLTEAKALLDELRRPVQVKGRARSL